MIFFVIVLFCCVDGQIVSKILSCSSDVLEWLRKFELYLCLSDCLIWFTSLILMFWCTSLQPSFIDENHRALDRPPLSPPSSFAVMSMHDGSPHFDGGGPDNTAQSASIIHPSIAQKANFTSTNAPTNTTPPQSSSSSQTAHSSLSSFSNSALVDTNANSSTQSKNADATHTVFDVPYGTLPWLAFSSLTTTASATPTRALIAVPVVGRGLVNITKFNVSNCDALLTRHLIDRITQHNNNNPSNPISTNPTSSHQLPLLLPGLSIPLLRASSIDTSSSPKKVTISLSFNSPPDHFYACSLFTQLNIEHKSLPKLNPASLIGTVGIPHLIDNDSVQQHLNTHAPNLHIDIARELQDMDEVAHNNSSIHALYYLSFIWSSCRYMSRWS